MIHPGEKHGILSIPGSHPLSISTICPDMTAHLAARNRKEEVEREIAQGPSEPVPKMSDERGKLTSPSFILCSSKRKKTILLSQASFLLSWDLSLLYRVAYRLCYIVYRKMFEPTPLPYRFYADWQCSFQSIAHLVPFSSKFWSRGEFVHPSI